MLNNIVTLSSSVDPETSLAVQLLLQKFEMAAKEIDNLPLKAGIKDANESKQQP